MLNGALRFVLFRAPRTPRRPLGVPALLLCMWLALLLQGAESYVLNGVPGHLEWQVLPDLLFPVGVLWFGLWAVSVVLRRPAELGLLFGEVLAARVLYLLLELALQVLGLRAPDDVNWQAHIDLALNALQILWLLAVLVRIGKVAATGRPRLLLAWGCFAAPWLLLMLLFPAGDLWQADSDTDDLAPPTQAMSEAAFYNQQNLFGDALDALRPERPGVDDLYYLGVAGDAGTAAFRNEVVMADALLAERFDTTGRSVLLVNDPAPNPARPFASRTNLEAALARFAEVMDVEDDILLLFLSSHGTRDHTLVLAQPALALGDIDPAGLRQALDQSGIRWRIVVVSACYSGAFANALRDDHTLVMTASDADHPSFGCGTADRYTWFGQALFDEQLRKTLSFPEAFRDAARSIAEREKTGHEQPSNPQIFMGAAMVPKLAALQARLSQPGGPAGSVQAMNDGEHAVGAQSVVLRSATLAPQRRCHPARRPRRRGPMSAQAGMSGVSEQARMWISSFRRSLRFFSLRKASSSTPSASL